MPNWLLSEIKLCFTFHAGATKTHFKGTYSVDPSSYFQVIYLIFDFRDFRAKINATR